LRRLKGGDDCNRSVFKYYGVGTIKKGWRPRSEGVGSGGYTFRIGKGSEFIRSSELDMEKKRKSGEEPVNDFEKPSNHNNGKVRGEKGRGGEIKGGRRKKLELLEGGTLGEVVNWGLTTQVPPIRGHVQSCRNLEGSKG